MSLLCKLFGHKPEKAYGDRKLLFLHSSDWSPYYDGIYRAHRKLKATCDRCGEKYTFAKTIDPLLCGEYEEIRMRKRDQKKGR